MLVNLIFIVIGAAGLLSCILCLIALHVLPTGYQPFRDPVSNYAVSRYGYLYRIQAFSSGICAACLFVWFVNSGILLPAWGVTALAFYSLSRLLIVFFPTDVKPPWTRTGRIHAILATLTFAGIAIAVGALTPSLTSLVVWLKMGWALQAATLLTDAAAVAFVVAFAFRLFHPIVGLIERFIYVGTLIWLTVVFGQLILNL